MRKITYPVVVLALTAGSAFAADLPSRKGPPVLPPPPPPAPIWTGFYVGLNAGAVWENSSSVQTVAAPFFANPINPNGPPVIANALAFSANNWFGGNDAVSFIGGGQIGYNRQLFTNFVVGVEADIQGIAGSSSSQSVGKTASLDPIALAGEAYVSAAAASRSLDYIGTVRGRVGWLAIPTLLIYGTGGFAYGGVSMNTAFMAQDTLSAAVGLPQVLGGSSLSDTRTGWTAGGGVEWMFLPNWSAKVEYLYYDLGSLSSNGVLVQTSTAGGGTEPWAAVATQTSARFNGNIVRAGLNYHFNWGAPAPVVAKY